MSTLPSLTSALSGTMLPTTVTHTAKPGTYGIQKWNTLAGGTSQADALRAMELDRQAAQAQLDQGIQARTAAVQGMTPIASGQTAAGMKTQAASQAEAQKAALSGAKAEGSAALQGAQAAAQALGPAAEARRAEALQAAGLQRDQALADVNARQAGAMEQFKDDTALGIQTQRVGLMSGLAQTKQNIINEAASRGVAADSPEVAQAIRQVEMGTMGQLGNIAASTAMAYNDARSKLSLAYDNMGTQVRSIQDQLALTTRAEGDKYTGLSQAQGAELQARVAEAQSSLAMSAELEGRLIDQQMSSLQVSADQLTLAGAGTLGEYIRSWDVMLAPLAPIVSLAASLTSKAYQANNASVEAANQNVGAVTPMLQGGFYSPGASQVVQGAGGGYPSTNAAMLYQAQQGNAQGQALGGATQGDVSGQLGYNPYT